MILTGGKDSENALLLPWNNPVIVASGPPNDELNRDFLSKNDLDYKFISLEHDDLSYRDAEILANCCGSALEHKRWVPHLIRIVEELKGRAIIWAGQLADTFLTPRWRGWDGKFRRKSKLERIIGRLERSRMAPLLPMLGLNVNQRMYFNSMWSRGSTGEGHYLAGLRAIVGCPALSIYHGPRTMELVRSVSFQHMIRSDIRPEIGAILHGNAVWYPDTNPGPVVMAGKKDWAQAEHFIELVRSLGVSVFE